MGLIPIKEIFPPPSLPTPEKKLTMGWIPDWKTLPQSTRYYVIAVWTTLGLAVVLLLVVN